MTGVLYPTLNKLNISSFSRQLALYLIYILPITPSSHSLSSSKSSITMGYTFQPDRKAYDGMRVTSLHRYAIKGLSADSMSSVKLNERDGTFEDDRRFALLYDTSGDAFDGEDPSWLHKENFLCAFTAPELLANLDTEYRVETTDDDNGCDANNARRVLTIWDRKLGRSSSPLLGPIDLACSLGREKTAQYFTNLCGRKVQCVVANFNNDKSSASRLSNVHSHQFGNTSSGVKNNNGDTRTIHIINENTVRQFSEAIYGKESDSKYLTSTRFRPNIIVDNLEPWAEFDLIGKVIEAIPGKSKYDTQDTTPLRFRIVSRTVRCAGVGVDPLHPELGILDIPNLLSKHFPQHGPYLGVYAILENHSSLSGGVISVGDSLRVVED